MSRHTMPLLNSPVKDTSIRRVVRDYRQHYVVRNVVSGVKPLFGDNLARFAIGFLLFVTGLAIFGPYIAPYPYGKTLYQNGELLRSKPPSIAHPLGTNSLGQDVLSRIIIGARPTLLAGLVGGLLIISIGMAVGITAGFVGGRTESLLMRFTDFVYGVPLIPFAIVLITFLGTGFLEIIFVIGIILWRGSARVLRSQVLQIKERPYILSAKATGASTFRIIVKHVLPNVAPMAVLFFALGIGYAILLQAGLAFIGLVNPFVPSWGIMIRNAYRSGIMSIAWWWSIPPGIMISLTVMSAFLIGRRYEAIAGENDEEAFLQSG